MILAPSHRIFLDIPSRISQTLQIADDAIEISPLPERTADDTISKSAGCYRRFEPGHECAE
jgi:hypothetical protein